MLLSIMSVFTGCADDRDWLMDWRCFEFGTIVPLTVAGEKKLYFVSVPYFLLLFLWDCVYVVLCCCGCQPICDFHLVVHSSANRRL